MTHPDQADCAVSSPIPPTAGESASPAPPIIALPEKEPAGRKGGLLAAIAGVFVVAGLGYLGWAKLIPASWRSDERLQHLPTMTVGKVDLSTVLTAWGRVESSSNTIISCELERLEIRAQGGRSMSSGGASMILTLIDEGTQVKKGDVLCTLDSSEYEELVRTQEIKTEQADAARQQAKLSFEVAELAVEEFRNGLYNQQLQSYEGMIALSQSDVERTGDRLEVDREDARQGVCVGRDQDGRGAEPGPEPPRPDDVQDGPEQLPRVRQHEDPDGAVERGREAPVRVDRQHGEGHQEPRPTGPLQARWSSFARSGPPTTAS